MLCNKFAQISNSLIQIKENCTWWGMAQFDFEFEVNGNYFALSKISESETINYENDQGESQDIKDVYSVLEFLLNKYSG